jgi:glycine dehydrogenase
MIAIRAEIDAIAAGDIDVDESVLRRSPHPAEDLLADEWDRPYSRAVAAYPAEHLRQGKYWPPVGRIDNAFGDRHLVCSCPPMEAYQDDSPNEED